MIVVQETTDRRVVVTIARIMISILIFAFLAALSCLAKRLRAWNGAQTQDNHLLISLFHKGLPTSDTTIQFVLMKYLQICRPMHHYAIIYAYIVYSLFLGKNLRVFGPKISSTTSGKQQ